MGLAAAEIGLQVHHWRTAVVPFEPLDGSGQQILQSFGQIGAIEKLDRIAVRIARLAHALVERDLVQVGREFGRGEPSGSHVVVRTNHLAPRLHALSGSDHERLVLADLACVVLVHGALQGVAYPAHIGWSRPR